MALSLAAAIDRLAMAGPTKMALISPLQKKFRSLDYAELSARSLGLAGNLSREYGYTRGDIIVSDLPNTSENLILQLACSRLGVAYSTVKDATGMAALREKHDRIRGVVTTSTSSVLYTAQLFHPPILASDEASDDMLHQYMEESSTFTAATDGKKVEEDTPWAYFNSTSPLRHSEIMKLGADSSRHLKMTASERVCVSITLCHAFGVGSACAGTLSSGAAVVLPAVGGISGCGVPSQRAAAAFDVLASEQCSLLFADTHIFKALPPVPAPARDGRGTDSSSSDGNAVDPPALPSLRGGVVKVGSGSDFMPEKVRYGNVEFSTMSKRPAQ
jgi:acyl-coenzyme A synthetase/AMP-(fatty) acid ligase